jgi:PhoPQ-activated pathogenicity-related protein
VAVSMAVKDGYGGHLTSLDDSKVDSIMKVCLSVLDQAVLVIHIPGS